MSKIQGITYNHKQAEYQYFPEEYFSGSDVAIYFNDVYIDDMMGIEFSLQERLQPVYGYNSYTFDAVGRGQRIIQGSFTIAFKEAGYLYSVLDHLGKTKSLTKPAISYHVAEQGDQVPEWAGNINETIDQILNRSGGGFEEDYVMVKAPDWPPMSLGSNGEPVKLLQEYLLSKLPARYQGLVKVTSYSLKENMSRVTNGAYGWISYGEEVKRLKKRLNAYLYTSGFQFIKKPLDETNGLFDAETEAAVRTFQKKFSTSLTIDGMVGEQTRDALNKALTINGSYDAPTKLAVIQFQRACGVQTDGVYTPAQLKDKIEMRVSIAPDKLAKGAEGSYADYEASIWGDESVNLSDRHDQPFFYGSANQTVLQTEGFDIYINYGPLPEAVIQDGVVQDYLNFSNTIKAIRNVQIQGVTQVIGPTGEAIAERYMFLAKDID